VEPAVPSSLVLDQLGGRAAFISSIDLDPRVGSADGSTEAFFFDLPEGPARQITNGPRLGFPAVSTIVMTPDG
jgi:hypothetical protein